MHPGKHTKYTYVLCLLVLCLIHYRAARRMVCTVHAHLHTDTDMLGYVHTCVSSGRLIPHSLRTCTGNTGTGTSPACIHTTHKHTHTVTHTLPGTHLVTQIFAQNFRLREPWSLGPQVRTRVLWDDRVADPRHNARGCQGAWDRRPGCCCLGKDVLASSVETQGY